MKAPRYLGLDIGTNTGWAVAEGNRIVDSGVRDFSTKTTEHIGKRGIRFYNFMLSIGQVDEIYYEKIQFAPKGFSNDGGELYKGFLMLMNMCAAGFNIPTFGVWPGTLKKSFTGDGHAKKEDMCRMAHHIGWQGGKVGTALYHDEADAIALIYTQLRDKYGVKLTF